MKEITELLHMIGIDLKFLIVGFLGGLISVIAKRKQNEKENLPHQTISAQLTTIFVGGMTSTYLTPVVIDFVKVGEDGKFGIAFVVGYLGLIGMEKIIDKFNLK